LNKLKTASSKEKICPKCPAGLVCVQHPIASLFKCRNCGDLIVYHEVGRISGDTLYRQTRAVIKRCLRTVTVRKIKSCFQCAVKYAEGRGGRE